MSKKVRFSCPRCLTVLQTDEDRIGCQIGCPHCAFRFQLNPPGSTSSTSTAVGSAMTDQSTSDNIPASSPSTYLDSPTLPPKSVERPSAQSVPLQSVPVQPNHPHGYVPDERSASFVDIGGAHGPPPCPNCNSRAPALVKSEVSTVGWIIFAILLMTTVVFCWIGVLIRDKYRICSYCKIRLGRQ